MCSDLTPKVGQSPQAYLPVAAAGPNDAIAERSHSFQSYRPLRALGSVCCSGASSLLLDCAPPSPLSVAPALPAPLCSAICSHHIGIITWGREGLAFL